MLSSWYCNIHERNPLIIEEFGNLHGLRTGDMHILNDLTLSVKYFTQCTDKPKYKVRSEMIDKSFRGKHKGNSVSLFTQQFRNIN